MSFSIAPYFCSNFSRDYEPASRWFSIFALLVNWRPDQLAEQGFGQATDFRMPWHYCCERTAKAADSILSIFLLKFCHTAHFVQHLDGSLKTDTQVSFR